MPRRRTLLASVLALSAFGLTTGLTASMSVSAGDLGAGSAAVSACDADGVSVAYGLSPADATSLTSVTLSGLDATCAGQSVVVELVGAAGVLIQLTGTADASGAMTLPIAGGVAAADVTDVNTVITG